MRTGKRSGVFRGFFLAAIAIGFWIIVVPTGVSMAAAGENDPFDRSAREAGISPASIRVHHQALVDIATRAGGLDSGVRMNAAGEQVVAYQLDRYREAGLENVRLEPFYPNRWWPEKWDLAIVEGAGGSGQPLNAFPLWTCEGADQLELEVVYVGFGTSGEFRGKDVRGKAVLLDMKRILHFIPSYRYTKALDTALKKGARAIIVAETRVDAPTGDKVGDIGVIQNQKAAAAKLFPVPAMSIGKTEGRLLRERVAAGPTRVRMNLAYSLAPATAYNLVGELPGNGEIDEWIILGGHYDTWFDGAVDNLGSQAAIGEMARYWARVPKAQRKRNLMFVSLFGHEYGTNAEMGHGAFVEKRADLAGKVTCFLDIDGSGSSGWEEKDDSGEILPTGADDKGGILTTSWALTAIGREAVYGYAQGPWGQYPLNTYVADLHGPIADAGWPCLLLISKHIYYHTPMDTLDRITPDQVYRRTLMNIRATQAMMDSPAGYLMGVDANPKRKFRAGETAQEDLTPEALPPNPNPWLTGAPTDLSMHVIPETPHVFSPVLTWIAYFKVDAVAMADQVAWNFHNLLGLFKPPKPHLASGSMYFLPGRKTITMTVTDSQGRSSEISREVTVTAGPLAWAYWTALAVGCLIGLWILRIVLRKIGGGRNKS